MKIRCHKCKTEDNLVNVNCGSIFLGYLCTRHNLLFIKILTKKQEQYFQESIEEYMKFVSSTEE